MGEDPPPLSPDGLYPPAKYINPQGKCVYPRGRNRVSRCEGAVLYLHNLVAQDNRNLAGIPNR